MTFALPLPSQPRLRVSQSAPRISGTGTLTFPSPPAMGSSIIVFEIAAQGIASVLPTGGGATWAQLAFLSTSGQSGGAIYIGTVNGTRSASVGVTASGNVADFVAFEFPAAPHTPDKSQTVGGSAGTLSASVAPSLPGFGVFLHSSRQTSQILTAPQGWIALPSAPWANGTYSIAWGPTRWASASVTVISPGNDCLLIASVVAP